MLRLFGYEIQGLTAKASALTAGAACLFISGASILGVGEGSPKTADPASGIEQGAKRNSLNLPSELALMGLGVVLVGAGVKIPE